jgi:hypothetical protein
MLTKNNIYFIVFFWIILGIIFYIKGFFKDKSFKYFYIFLLLGMLILQYFGYKKHSHSYLLSEENKQKIQNKINEVY